MGSTSAITARFTLPIFGAVHDPDVRIRWNAPAWSRCQREWTTLFRSGSSLSVISSENFLSAFCCAAVAFLNCISPSIQPSRVRRFIPVTRIRVTFIDVFANWRMVTSISYSSADQAAATPPIACPISGVR